MSSCKHGAAMNALCMECSKEGTINGHVVSITKNGGVLLGAPGAVTSPEEQKAPKASKNDQAKIDLSLIPYIAQVAEAKAFQVGEKKYGRYNYCKGHKASQLIAAAQRHLLAWFQGEENDPVDGQPHLGSVRACMAMLLRQQELGTMIDDRFKPGDEK